jgi:hypothetical protein
LEVGIGFGRQSKPSTLEDLPIYTEFIYSNRDFYIAIALCSSLLHSAIAIDIAIRVDELGTNVRSRAALSKKVGRYDIFLAPRAQVAKCQMFVENCQFFCSIVCVCCGSSLQRMRAVTAIVSSARDVPYGGKHSLNMLDARDKKH